MTKNGDLNDLYHSWPFAIFSGRTDEGQTRSNCSYIPFTETAVKEPENENIIAKNIHTIFYSLQKFHIQIATTQKRKRNR